MTVTKSGSGSEKDLPIIMYLGSRIADGTGVKVFVYHLHYNDSKNLEIFWFLRERVTYTKIYRGL